jgi:hypothetical protein
LSRECAAGLVCNENQGGVFCDFPKTGSEMKADSFIEKTLNATSPQVSLSSASTKPSASAQIQSIRVTPSHVSEHAPPHATVPALPKVNTKNTNTGSVPASNAKANQYSNNPELDDAEIDTNDNQLGKGRAKLAVEHPGENAQLI